MLFAAPIKSRTSASPSQPTQRAKNLHEIFANWIAAQSPRQIPVLDGASQGLTFLPQPSKGSGSANRRRTGNYVPLLLPILGTSI
jgi:hypothetical protein